MGKSYSVAQASAPRPGKKVEGGKVTRVSIEPSDNGGYTVTCSKEPPKAKKGEPYPFVEPDTYVYTTGAEMMAHVGEIFGVKAVGKTEP